MLLQVLFSIRVHNAGFLTCGVPLALYFALNSSRRAEKFLGIVCLVSVGIILPATMSRAAWIAAVVGTLPVIILYITSQRYNSKIIKNSKNVTIAIVVSGALFVGFMYGLYSFKKNSAEGRLLIWRVSATLVSEKPLTGSGLGSFLVLYDGAQADYFLSGKASPKQHTIADSPEYTFNEYVQITVEHGIIGLLLFLGIVFSIFASKVTPVANKSLVFAIKGSLLAFLVFAFFSYPFSILSLTILFVVLIAMLASQLQPIEYLKTTRFKFGSIFLFNFSFIHFLYCLFMVRR